MLGFGSDIFFFVLLEFGRLITVTAIDVIKKRSLDLTCEMEEFGISRPKSDMMRAGASRNSR